MSKLLRLSISCLLAAATANGQTSGVGTCVLPDQPEVAPRLWTNGVVYYEFDSNVTDANRALMQAAMREWANSGANVRFLPRAAGVANYLHVKNSTGNSSFVGMVGPGQLVNIQDWAVKSTLVHELGHALGFWHEQSRWDRDQYITVNHSNIQSTFLGQFNVFGPFDWITSLTPYDYSSVMHYDKCAFSICCPPAYTCNCAAGCEVISAPNLIGQRAYLSHLDMQDLMDAYGSTMSTIASWGTTNWGLMWAPPPAFYVDLDASWRHTIARTHDGSVVVWGDNSDGAANVPSLPAGVRYAAVSAGRSFNLGLLTNGSAIGWGWNLQGNCNVPTPPQGLHYVAVAAGQKHSLVLRSDGWLVAFGANGSGQCNVPSLPAGRWYVQAAGGWLHSIARLSDGNIAAWGANSYGQTDVPPLPAGVVYVDIDAGEDHSIALRSDGQAVAWGRGGSGQCDVPMLPPGLTYVAVAAGGYHSAALRSDGVLKLFGSNSDGQLNGSQVPPSGYRYVDIAPGWDHTAVRLAPIYGSTLSYCTPGTSTNGCNALLNGTGTASATATTGFTLVATSVEGQRMGYLYYGVNGAVAAPWGISSSFMCVAAPRQRMSANLPTGGTAGSCDGVVSQDWNSFMSTHPVAIGQPLASGLTVWAQAWYRDPPSPKTTNLSNGLQFTVMP